MSQDTSPRRIRRAGLIGAVAVLVAGGTGMAIGAAQKNPSSKRDILISGRLTESLYPGSRFPLDLTFTNPHNFDVTIDDSLTIAAESTTPACPVVPNAVLPQLRNIVVERGRLGSVVLPRKSTRKLSQLISDSNRWPHISMPNLPTNQDGCKNATFTLRYEGTGVK